MGRKPKEQTEQTNVEEVVEKKKRGPKKKETKVENEIMNMFKELNMEEYKIDENELVNKLDNLHIDEQVVKKQKKEEIIIKRPNNISLSDIEIGTEFNIYFEEKLIFYQDVNKYTDEELETKSFVFGLLFYSDDSSKIIGKENKNNFEVLKHYRLEKEGIIVNFYKTNNLNTNELCNTFWLYKRRRDFVKKDIYKYIINDNLERIEENRKINKLFKLNTPNLKLSDYEFKKIYVKYRDQLCIISDISEFFVLLYENE